MLNTYPDTEVDFFWGTYRRHTHILFTVLDFPFFLAHRLTVIPGPGSDILLFDWCFPLWSSFATTSDIVLWGRLWRLLEGALSPFSPDLLTLCIYFGRFAPRFLAWLNLNLTPRRVWNLTVFLFWPLAGLAVVLMVPVFYFDTLKDGPAPLRRDRKYFARVSWSAL